MNAESKRWTRKHARGFGLCFPFAHPIRIGLKIGMPWPDRLYARFHNYTFPRFASLANSHRYFFPTRTDETRCEKFAVDRSLSLINRESGSKLAAQKIRANRSDSNCSTKDSFVRKQWPRSILLKGSIDNSKRFEENSSKNNVREKKKTKKKISSFYLLIICNAYVV